MLTFNILKVDDYGNICEETAEVGQLLSFVAVNNMPCAILKREDGSLLTADIKLLRERKNDGRTELGGMGATNPGGASNNTTGNGPVDPGTEDAKGSLRGEEERVGRSVPTTPRSGTKSNRRTQAQSKN